jgi:hypothetical protein
MKTSAICITKQKHTPRGSQKGVSNARPSTLRGRFGHLIRTAECEQAHGRRLFFYFEVFFVGGLKAQNGLLSLWLET